MYSRSPILAMETWITVFNVLPSGLLTTKTRWRLGVLGDGGSGNLPSDADDTALATLALLRSKATDGAEAISRGLDWLTAHQSPDGSCSTYLPGQGDVGCVSITAHAIEAWREATGMEAQIDRACQWLEDQITKEGCWSDVWLAKRTYGTACAIIGLIRAGKTTSRRLHGGFVGLSQYKTVMAAGVRICSVN